MSSDEQPFTGWGCLQTLLHWMAPTGFLILLLLGVALTIAMPDLAAASMEGVTAMFMGVFTAVQLMLMLGGACFGVLFLRATGEQGSFFAPSAILPRVRQGLALGGARAPWFLAAGLGCMTVGLLPGWVAEQLLALEISQTYRLGDSLQLVGRMLSDTSDPGWWAMAFAVVIMAPLGEEMLFRGYLWRAAEKSLPMPVVFVVTSLFFAVYHSSPVHVVAVLPIGLYLGWLRWMSGSIWPSMLGHFVNNALATALAVTADPEASGPGLVLCLLGSVFTVGVGALTWWWCRTHPASYEELLEE